jgi:sarcosine oxidase/L-pipecolate oxidase
MGTVMFVDIPKDRKDLREKFHPYNFPVWRFIQGDGEGQVTFPVSVVLILTITLDRMKEVDFLSRKKGD